MKQFKFILICMAVVVTLNAKHEGTFTVENIEKSGDFFEIDTLTVKYSVGFLMGEMVLDANAKYSLGNYITVDGTIHRMNEFPDEVKNELKLTELKVQVGVVSGLALPNMNVSIDLGAMGKPNTWSYNTSSSPNWDKFIYSGIHEVPMYFDKEKTIKVMKEFKRFGLGEHLSGARTGSIGYDVSAVRDFLIKQKKDKAKSAEEKLKKAEEQLKETKGEKQKTAIEDIVKSKEQVITAKKDLLAELERKESAEYKKRLEKENKDALDALFVSLEKVERRNYNARVNKTKKDTTVKSKKRIVNMEEVECKLLMKMVDDANKRDGDTSYSLKERDRKRCTKYFTNDDKKKSNKMKTPISHQNGMCYVIGNSYSLYPQQNYNKPAYNIGAVGEISTYNSRGTIVGIIELKFDRSSGHSNTLSIISFEILKVKQVGSTCQFNNRDEVFKDLERKYNNWRGKHYYIKWKK